MTEKTANRMMRISAGTGNPRNAPVPHQLKLSSRMGIGIASVSSKAPPFRAENSASVTMKEGTPKNARTAPAHRPIAVATASTITVAIGKGPPPVDRNDAEQRRGESHRRPYADVNLACDDDKRHAQPDDPGEGHLAQDIENVRDGGEMGRKN